MYRFEKVELARDMLLLEGGADPIQGEGGSYPKGGKSASLGEVLVELGWLLLSTGGSGSSKSRRGEVGGDEA